MALQYKQMKVLTKIFSRKKFELPKEESVRFGELSSKISEFGFYKLTPNEQKEYLKLSARDFNAKFKGVIKTLANE